MTNGYSSDPMVEMFIFETLQLIEQLETSVLTSEKSNEYTADTINEIFRIMHTIKGSAAMMLYDNISEIAHTVEDIFYFIREEKPETIQYENLSDLVLESVDFIKSEIESIKMGEEVQGDPSAIVHQLKEFLSLLKRENGKKEISQPINSKEEVQQYYIPQNKENTVYKNYYKAVIHFEKGCEMENIRAYSIIHNLKEITNEFYHIPEDIMENDETSTVIQDKGFIILFNANKSYSEIHELLMKTIFLERLNLIQLDHDEELKELMINKRNDQELRSGISIQEKIPEKRECQQSSHQSMISVNVSKLDKLMDLVGEMVIAEAMVTQNPDLKGLELNNFHKASRQLHKITGELQDMVMSIRMVPLATTFHKMHRIIRDITKKLQKEVRLEVIGEDTEVDKNIIESISDPLMHLVRNATDHGIESIQERVSHGKESTGCITLEAKNSGSDVLIIVKDDGRGLDKEKILHRAREKGMIYKPESEMSDKDIFNLIFLPGFSTKENVSEFSGRGVGMDVVTKNIEKVGGAVSVDSITGEGTMITIKIPLTLAIIDGMNIRVGAARYTLPTISIKESFRPKEKDIITDLQGNEMIMVRGQCYPVLRLHQLFKVNTNITEFSEGILIMVEGRESSLCIFADELLGEQQVVVKALPSYIKNIGRLKGLAGCTLLGDGSISLILDIEGLIGQ